MKFPLKKCLISSLIITLVALLILGLLISIVSSNSIPDKAWIFLLVWGLAYGLGLAAYWIYQFYLYHKSRKK